MDEVFDIKEMVRIEDYEDKVDRWRSYGCSFQGRIKETVCYIKWLFWGKDRFGRAEKVRSTLMISFVLFFSQYSDYGFLHYLKEWENLDKLYRTHDTQQLFWKRLASRILL